MSIHTDEFRLVTMLPSIPIGGSNRDKALRDGVNIARGLSPEPALRIEPRVEAGTLSPNTAAAAPHSELASWLASSVSDCEFERLLGLPSGGLDGGADARLLELARQSRTFFEENSNPSLLLRVARVVQVDDARLQVAVGTPATVIWLASPALARRVRHNKVCTLMAIGVTAGSAIERDIARDWKGRPDRAWFRERFAVAAVEHGIRHGLQWKIDSRHEPSAEWLALSNESQASIDSTDGPTTPTDLHAPGHPGWPIADLAALHSLLTSKPATGDENGSEAAHTQGPIGLMQSGMLAPKISMLAAYTLSPPAAAGSVPSNESTRASISPCTTCPMIECDYRRS
ncbi:MAG: hypothetical protein ACI841_003258 [Planctomycetota bacterium]